MDPRCIVSDRFRFICVLIAKNASSTLEGELLRPEYQSRRVRASELTEEERADYATFAFLRDPVSRLLSGYQEISLRHEMGEGGSNSAAFAEMEDDMSRFAAFLDALEAGYLDNHVRPQVDFLEGMRIDRYGSVECLDADLQQMLAEFDVETTSPLPRRRSREGRRRDYDYARFDIEEAQIPADTLDRIRSLYAADFANYMARVVRPYAHSGRLLKLYREENEGREIGVVYRLGTRGFYAELTTVARAMLYGLTTGRGLAIDSRGFSYRREHGWRDYFEPFCPEIEDDAALASIAAGCEVCDSEVRGPGTRFDVLRGHRVERVRVGPVPIDGFMNILGALFTSIHRYRPWLAEEIERRIEKLGLGPAHAAIHIRRGDKVGDEDIHYPSELYIERLKRSDPRPLPVFVLSDEHAAVEELRGCFARRGEEREVISLTEPKHVGFDVFALRREDLHERSAAATGGSPSDFRSFIFEEARRLLSEIEIAVRSQVFVGTFYSNIGKSVRFLHPEPERCVLLLPHHVEPFEAARGRTPA